MEDLRALDEAAGPDPDAPGEDASLLDRAAEEVCALDLPTLAELRAGPPSETAAETAPGPGPDAPLGPARP